MSAENFNVRCPQCGSVRLWRDGIRYTGFDQVQRYLCRLCGYRFSDPASKLQAFVKQSENSIVQQKTRGFNGSGMSESVQKIHTQSLKSRPYILGDRQICVTEAKGAKNLVAAENQTQATGISPLPDTETIKGKILEFLWQLEKNG